MRRGKTADRLERFFKGRAAVEAASQKHTPTSPAKPEAQNPAPRAHQPPKK